MLYLYRMCQCGLHSLCTASRCRTSVHLCTASRQNLAVPLDIYSSLSVPLERSCWPRIRWCGTGGFQEQGQCFFYWTKLLYSYCSLLLFFPFYSSCLYVGIWGAVVFGIIDLHSLSALHSRPLLIITIIIMDHYWRQPLESFQCVCSSIQTKRHGQYRRFVGSITLLPRIVRSDFFLNGCCSSVFHCASAAVCVALR